MHHSPALRAATIGDHVIRKLRYEQCRNERPLTRTPYSPPIYRRQPAVARSRTVVHFFTRGKVITSRWLDPSHGGLNLGFPQNA